MGWLSDAGTFIRLTIRLNTEALFLSKSVARFKNIERVAGRKLLQLHAVTRLKDLKIPPGNHLELLKKDRKGQYSIRINHQWRICFIWKLDGFYQVKIIDCH